MKKASKKVQSVKASERKVDLVIRELEKQVPNGYEPAGSCSGRIYCV